MRPLTSRAALVDDGAQRLAYDESQVGTFVDSHAEDASDAFEGCQQVHGTCAEAGEHGPDLKENQDILNISFTWALYSDFWSSVIKLPVAVESGKLWPQVSVLLAPTPQLKHKNRVINTHKKMLFNLFKQSVTHLPLCLSVEARGRKYVVKKPRCVFFTWSRMTGISQLRGNSKSSLEKIRTPPGQFNH